MNRPLRKLIAFGPVLLFAFGMWCASMAAPGLSIASVTGCSESGGPMEMAGCNLPAYLCGFDSSSSPRVLSSTRYNDDSKKAHVLVVGETPIDASNGAASLTGKESKDAGPIYGPYKVSIRLFNSVLTL